MEKRTEQESQRKKRAMTGLLVLFGTAKSLQNDPGFSGKTLKTGPSERESVASVPQGKQLASTPEPHLRQREHSYLSRS